MKPHSLGYLVWGAQYTAITTAVAKMILRPLIYLLLTLVLFQFLIKDFDEMHSSLF